MVSQSSTKILLNYQCSTIAKDGLQNSLEIMIEIMIDEEQFDYAKSLIDSLPRRKKELEKYLVTKMQQNAQREAETQRIQKIAAEYDRRTSIKSRKILATAISVICFLLVVSVLIYDHLFKPTITPERLLVTTGSVAFTVFIFIFLGRKTLFTNEVGRRLATSLGAGSLGMIIVAFSGYKIEKIPTDYLMLIDLVLVAITFSTAYPSIRNGMFIGLATLVLIVITLFEPSWAHTCLLISAMIASWGTLFDWYKEDQS